MIGCHSISGGSVASCSSTSSNCRSSQALRAFISFTFGLDFYSPSERAASTVLLLAPCDRPDPFRADVRIRADADGPALRAVDLLLILALALPPVLRPEPFPLASLAVPRAVPVALPLAEALRLLCFASAAVRPNLPADTGTCVDVLTVAMALAAAARSAARRRPAMVGVTARLLRVCSSCALRSS